MVTVQIARYYLAAMGPHHHVPAASTIRSWIHRGKVNRAPDGGIDLGSLLEHMGLLHDTQASAA